MKRRLLCLLLCAAMLLGMVGCGQTAPTETTAPATTAPAAPLAADLYADARSMLDNATHLSMEVVITTVTEVAGEKFSQKSAQVLTYKDISTDDAVIVCQEDLFFRVHG